MRNGKYRTDLDGTVIISTDGNSWSVNAEPKPVPNVVITSIPTTVPTIRVSQIPTTIPTIKQPTVISTPVSVVKQSSSSAPCDCTGPDLNCKTDFSSHSEAQECFEYCKSKGYGDIFGLDGENDGDACEGLK